MAPKPNLRNKILALLQDGPMTLAEIHEIIHDREPVTLDAALRDAKKAGYVRIHGWHRNLRTGGQRSARWGLADGEPDVPKPRIPRAQQIAENQKRYNERNRLVIAMRKQRRKRGAAPSHYQLIYKPRA